MPRRINYKIPLEKRMEVLDCYRKGWGYKKTVKATGINRNLVRYYMRRFRSGNTTWADQEASDSDSPLSGR